MLYVIFLYFLKFKSTEETGISSISEIKGSENVFPIGNSRTYTEPKFIDLSGFINGMESNIDRFLENKLIIFQLKRTDDQNLCIIELMLEEDKSIFTSEFLSSKNSCPKDQCDNMACFYILWKIKRYDLIFYKLGKFETDEHKIQTIIYDCILYHNSCSQQSAYEKNKKSNIVEYYIQIIVKRLIGKCFENSKYLKTFIRYSGIIERDLYNAMMLFENKEEIKGKFIFHDIIYKYVNINRDQMINDASKNVILEEFVDFVFKKCQELENKISINFNDQTYHFIWNIKYLQANTENNDRLKEIFVEYKREDRVVHDILTELYDPETPFALINMRGFDKEKALILYKKSFLDTRLKDLGDIHPPLEQHGLFMAKISDYIGIIQDESKSACILIPKNISDLELLETKKKILNYDCVKTVESWLKRNLLSREPSWGNYYTSGADEIFDIKEKASLLLYKEYTKTFDQLARCFKPYTKILDKKHKRDINEDFITIFEYATEHLLTSKECAIAKKNYARLVTLSKRREQKESGKLVSKIQCYFKKKYN